MNALNCDKDICLLGEPNTYLTGQRSDFVSWFNEQQRNWGNQPTKSAYATRIAGLDTAAGGDEYMRALALRYKISGEKLALAPEDVSGHSFSRLKVWLELEHWDSFHVISLRQPLAVIRSSEKMLGTPRPKLIKSIAQTMILAIDMARTFPRVKFVVHEAVSARHFSTLGQWLGVDMRDSFKLYEKPAAKRNESHPGPEPDVAEITELHNQLARLIHAETLDIPTQMLQTEQRLLGFDDPRLNAVGSLYRRLTALATAEPVEPAGGLLA